jgi:ATP/maltotriose-dependent transcriptional regulator MalT
LLASAADLAEHGYEAFKSGETRRSKWLNEESLELARQVGDPAATARALAGLMRVSLRTGDFDQLERLARECDELAQAADDPTLSRLPLHMRAEAARIRGDFADARALYDASIGLNRQLGNDAMVAVEMANKAWVEVNTQRLDEAERLLRASLAATAIDDAYGVAFCLLGLARVELERGHERGAEILGAAENILGRDELVWDPAEEHEYERTLALARKVAGERVDDLRMQGQSLDAHTV